MADEASSVGDEFAAELRARPTVILVVGMAGSGKTTVMQRLAAHLRAEKKRTYIANLDPASTYVPYPVNIDIRDSLKYKEVMSELKLGPNGGIMTCLNLFATRIDQMLAILEAKAAEGLDYILVDTPGQVEAFTWSASGAVITQALASSFPTTLCYVADSERAAAPVTFASTLLYATSIMFRARLPMVLLFNKADVVRPTYADEWIGDVFALRAALDAQSSAYHSGGASAPAVPGGAYMATFSSSLALALCEFWEEFSPVEFSAMTGHGATELFEAVDRAREEFLASDLCAEILESRRLRAAERAAKGAKQVTQLAKDVAEADI